MIPANVACAEEVNFAINFRTGIWDHSALGRPVSSSGWAVNGATNRGYDQGTTFFSEANLSLTVQSRFFGGAAPGVDNFRLDPINTPGFAFQNAGTGDKNTTSLLNYQRIDFSFSSPVTMDFLELRDIDTSSSSGTQAWRDATGLELWYGTPPATPGLGIKPDITRYSPTNLTVDTTQYALPHTYATTLGNTQSSDRSAAIFEYDGQAVDGFSVYLWNRGAGTGGKHGIVLQAAGNRFIAQVPEPAGGLLLAMGGGMLFLRRRRWASKVPAP